MSDRIEDEIKPEDFWMDSLEDLGRVAPKNRDQFIRVQSVSARDRIADNWKSDYPTGDAVVKIGLLYMVYDFFMTVFQVGA